MAKPSFPSLACAVVSLLAIVVTANASDDLEQQLSLEDAPAVKIHVTFNNPSLQLHGEPSFDVFATPVVSANGLRVLYDGYATFVEDGTTYTYSYVDGVGYLSMYDGEKKSVRCISPRMLPFGDILPALNKMTPIESASLGDKMIKCTSGNLFKAMLGDVRFATCVAGQSGFMATSRDFTVNVEYLDSPVHVKKPALTDNLSCKVVAKAVSMTPTALSLLTGSEIPASVTRRLRFFLTEHMDLGESCACKSTSRLCVFFHGIGNKKEMEELQDTPKDAAGRMGNMNKHAPCCTDVKYAILNTLDYTWYDDELQQKFCDRALRLSDTSDKEQGVIKDTVVVTHSMAGLVMSMALATGKCSFGEGTSWVAISSPMMGTMASDYFQGYCEKGNAMITPGMLEFFDQCPLPAARQSLAYQNEKHASKELNEAYVAAQKAYADNVYAAMCSDNPDGVISQYEMIMILTSKMVPHKSPQNDGLVEFQSCAIGLDESQFSNSYQSKFYRPELNHADTAFLTHDALFQSSQKPMKWFECLL